MTLLPTLANWTKSLRDSLELTELVMLRGMRWCAALDRRREVACWPHIVIDGKQGQAYACRVERAVGYNPHIA